MLQRPKQPEPPSTGAAHLLLTCYFVQCDRHWRGVTDEKALKFKAIGLQEAKRLRFRGLRLSPAMLHRRVNEARTRFARDAARVAPATLTRRMETHRQTLQLLGRRADQCIAATLEKRSTRLAQAGRLAETLSHKSVLERGFALIRDADDKPVKSVTHIKPGDLLSIEFADGRAGAVASGSEAPAKPPARKQATKPKAGGGEQGSLF